MNPSRSARREVEEEEIEEFRTGSFIELPEKIEGAERARTEGRA
jgi:hypothetical protein